MNFKLMLQTSMITFFLGIAIFTGQVTMAQEPLVTEIEFITHVAADLPEQHVFVESDADPEQVVRVKGVEATAALGEPVYASATAVENDFLELGPNPLGPFATGEPLGFTLEEWLAATGSGTYTLNGDMAELNISFQNLVPNGVYTMWCSRIMFAPEFGEELRACGPADGSQNTFVADGDGNGTFQITMPALPPSTEDVISDIAAAYHSDGQTYGAGPGDFGRVTHVQLFIAEPPPAPESVPAALPQTGGVGHNAVGLAVIMLIGLLLIGTGWMIQRESYS